MRHDVRWHTAAPLWDLSLAEADGARFRAPAILRFASDGFMDELERKLAQDPAALAAYVLRDETWQAPAVGWHEAPGAGPPKLFHPAHGRFYLVAASLVCRIAGLPDRAVDAAELERVGFVLRRLRRAGPSTPIDPAQRSSFVEQGWFGDRQKGSWQPLADPDVVEPGEELLPMFPLGFRLEGVARRLHAGLVPVGSRELYEGREPAPSSRESVDDPLADPRVGHLVGGAIAALEGLAALGPIAAGTSASEQLALHASAREGLATAMLQLLEFIEEEMPALRDAIRAEDTAGLGLAGQTIVTRLDNPLVAGATTGLAVLNALAADDARRTMREGPITPTFTTTLFGAALTRGQVASATAGLLAGGALVADLTVELGDARLAAFHGAFTQPAQALVADAAALDDAQARERLLLLLLDLAEFLHRELEPVFQAIVDDGGPLAGANQNLLSLLGESALAGLSWRALIKDAYDNRKAIQLGQLDRRLALVAAGAGAAAVGQALGLLLSRPLAARIDGALPAAPPSAEPAPGVDDEPLYVARCVYERPRCARFEDPVVGAPSAAFRLAGYFDPDAPVRPVRIRLPVDTSVEGLSRFPKGVSMLLSNKLRQQMQRVQSAGLGDLEDGNIGGEPQLDLGMICTLSIPIITICAIILLMIIVQLLNIVFWWLPFFKICLPLNLKR